MQIMDSGAEDGDDEDSDTEFENDDYDSENNDSHHSSDGSEGSWVPRRQQVANKEAHGGNIRKKNGKLKFTKGTTPLEKDLVKFMASENVACPSFWPMLGQDTLLKPIHL